MVRATPQRSQPSLLGPERLGSYEKWRAVLNHDECSMHAEFEAMTYPGITDLLRPGFDTIDFQSCRNPDGTQGSFRPHVNSTST